MEESTVHQGSVKYILVDTMSTLGDIMSTSGNVQHIGGYHEYIRVFNIGFYQLAPPT